MSVPAKFLEGGIVAKDFIAHFALHSVCYSEFRSLDLSCKIMSGSSFCGVDMNA